MREMKYFPDEINPFNDKLFATRIAARDQKRKDRLATSVKINSKGETIFSPYFKVDDIRTLKQSIAKKEGNSRTREPNLVQQANKHKFREDNDLLTYDKPVFMVKYADRESFQGHDPAMRS